MLDFLKVSTKSPRRGVIQIYPKFIVKKSKDLMIRGGDFYAVWLEDKGVWSTEEQDALDAIDKEVQKFKEAFNPPGEETTVTALYMWDSSTKMIDIWHHYCDGQLRDNFHPLDERLIFANENVTKEDYATRKLPYPLIEGPIPNFDKLISTLYDPEERHKLEWAIGAIVAGDSVWIQKFVVLYGAMGTGKSTIIKIIQKLFDGYYSVFDAKALGNPNNTFALEPFKNNPLVAIQHDGDLSKIEDNTRLNSLVSHEQMTVNEKYKSTYANQFKSFLFMGTNKPVKITDAKSGLIRRLIDVTPSGRKLPPKEYKETLKGIEFELGPIAWHCKEVYLADPAYYDDYVPLNMLGASNDFYNFVQANYMEFSKEDSITLFDVWDRYKNYCDEAKVPFPYSQRIFKEELKNYFESYIEGEGANGTFKGFIKDKFKISVHDEEEKKDSWIELKEQKSVLDDILKECPAQYASEKGTPLKKWGNVTTRLIDLDTSRLHYVKVPENHIVIDFDIKGADGSKSFERNLEKASKWPKTYAESSKSGAGIHLHYIYDGDPSTLSRVYDDCIEVKVYTGNSSLRRMLTKCNDLGVAHISSGLPLKGDNKVLNWEGVKNEQMLRVMIQRNLKKEYHAATKPSVDYIYKLLEDAYNSGMKYDVSDMHQAVLIFAMNSTNQSDYCINLVSKMHWKSEDPSEASQNEEAPLVFFDVEVFPNLFIVNWKLKGKENPVVRMINPEPKEIRSLCKFNLVGFNNRKYDNHILYARMIGYSIERLYDLSTRLVNKKTERGACFGEAFNLSYTDVYDFCVKKQSLKKWEIKLGIHHKELGLPWDKPVPEELWPKVAEYCDNDVIATEAVFDARESDFIARKIQVELVKKLHGITNVSVNDTTNSLSAKIIFGKDKNPQSQFNYRDLSRPVPYTEYPSYRRKFGEGYVFKIFDENGLPTFRVYDDKTGPLPDGYSILPFFPGYTFDQNRNPKSVYLGEEIGEGGRVYSEPGMYTDVWDGDVSSQHPHSIIAEVLFGPKYTKIFEDIVEGRVDIKHKDFESAAKRLGGVLAPYLNDELADALAGALKIVVNSIYGVTAASFDNLFRDKRNVDNIVAKRGALFMTLLKSEVQKRGYSVCHIKTDSIKIPNADESIKEFVINFGKEYGYSFETEAEFNRYCLVNDAVYVAKYKEQKIDKKTGKEIWWMSVGTQFQIPYVFKTLFSKDPIEFDDLCETKSVKTAIYLDMNEGLPDGEHNYIFVGRVGRFTPIKPGNGGGLLMREGEDPKTGEVKYSSVTGSKGYRWLESETVKELGKENTIDRSYYDRLVDEAVEAISKYGDFEWFVSDDSNIAPYDIPDEPWSNVS